MTLRDIHIVQGEYYYTKVITLHGKGKNIIE